MFAEAAATGTALEMNGSPHRLDLAAERARRAVAAGCLLAIDSDAHRTEELDYVRLGRRARRAGRGSSRRTCSTPARARTCSPGSRQSRTGSDVPSAPMTTRDSATSQTPDPTLDPSAVLARRELVVAAVVMVALARARRVRRRVPDRRPAAGRHAGRRGRRPADRDRRDAPVRGAADPRGAHRRRRGGDPPRADRPRARADPARLRDPPRPDPRARAAPARPGHRRRRNRTARGWCSRRS